MAWIDDRITVHPKFTDLSDSAGWTWTKGIAYSCGFGTRGYLTAGQLRIIGATAKVRRELVAAGLWDDLEDGGVRIHDWDDHNGKRDARREADRERKRAARSTGKSNGTSAGQSAGRSTVAARVDGSEGSERKPRAVTSSVDPAPATDEQPSDFKIPNLKEAS